MDEKYALVCDIGRSGMALRRMCDSLESRGLKADLTRTALIDQSLFWTYNALQLSENLYTTVTLKILSVTD